MKLLKKLIPYLAGAVSIVLLIVFMPKKGKEKNFVGRITLDARDKNPYGCYAAFQLLKERFPGTPLVRSRAQPDAWEEFSWDTANAKQVLFIVTKIFDPSESDLDYIIGLAQKGNYVFISAFEMNEIARKTFKVKQSYLPISSDWDRLEENAVGGRNTMTLQLDSATFQPPWHYGYPGAIYANTFNGMDSNFTFQLGADGRGKANLLAIEAQNGALFLHSAPLSFTNLFVLYHNNHEYLEKLLSLLPEKPSKIVWDEYFLFRKTTEAPAKGVLSVILQYENFRWAFWTVLIVLGLYLATAVKRRQRMIPVYQKPGNDSLEFIETIGKLYYEKADHQNLALKMTQFFLEHIRNKYKMDTHYINTQFAGTLVLKSGVSRETADAIVDYIHKAQMGSITGEELTKYYNILDHFYKHT